jgi:hypothetical protein
MLRMPAAFLSSRFMPVLDAWTDVAFADDAAN